MYNYSPTAHSIALFLVLTAWYCSSVAKAEKDDHLKIHYTFKPESCDRKAKVTDLLTLHYKGALKDGTEFDSSYARNEPFSFQLGIGQVIKGWDKGLLEVCVGEKRQLEISPEYGYGDQAHDKIPAGSTLVFDVEVLKIEDGPKPANVFKEIDVDGDQQLSRKEVSDFLKKQFAQAGRSGDQGSAEDPDNGQMVEEIFAHEDKDKDGHITLEEFSGPKYDHDEL